MKPLTRYQRLKRRRELPKPDPAPPGFMWEGRSLVSVHGIEAWSRKAMTAYDMLPRRIRDIYKEGRST